MDVITRFLFLVSILSLAACADKSPSSVFPENTVQGLCAGGRIENQFIVNWEDGRQTIEKSQNAEAFVSEFLEPQMKLIRHVEFDKKVSIRTTVENIQETPRPISGASGDDWGQSFVEAPAVWAAGIKGQGATVAIVDTPVDFKHPQLKNRIAVNQAELTGVQGVDDDQNGFVDDVYGWDFGQNIPATVPVSGGSVHGTHVAGIVAAEHLTNQTLGLAPKASLVLAPFLSDDSNGEGSLGNAIRAMKYSAARGAKVINASWGGSQCSQSLKEAMAALSQQGVLMAVASGNSYLNLDNSPEYPAVFENPTQLTVAAVGVNGLMTRFSNSSYKYVQIAAPGEEIYNTFPRGSYDHLTGTSMATPFVAGAAALLWGYRPQATAVQIKAALLESVDVGQFRVSSQGHLNVRKAIQRIEALVPTQQ